jgi:hypothetical protein
MDTKVRIDAPRELVDRCIEWGRASKRGYREGKKEASRKYARPGIAESLDAQSMGKLGEVAFCLWANLDPLRELDWSPRLDPGFDLILNRARIDIKASNTDCLIWPVTKNRRLDTAPVDIFVLAEARQRPTIYLSGWITKKRFVAQHRQADEAHAFDTGTKFIHCSQLHRMAVFPGRVGNDQAKPFEHYCWCGEWGWFGYGPPQPPKFHGCYCAEHRPDRQEAKNALHV